MKKFSKIVESNDENQYRVDAYIQLVVPAENEGEAGYLSDSILSSVDYNYDYTINNIEKTDLKIEDGFIKESKSFLRNSYCDSNSCFLAV